VTDILAIKGVEALAAYLVNEIQEVYRLQGVTINDKHIETIVRQMLQKVEITDPGDSDYLKDEQVDRTELRAANEKLVDEARTPGFLQKQLLLVRLIHSTVLKRTSSWVVSSQQVQVAR